MKAFKENVMALCPFIVVATVILLLIGMLFKNDIETNRGLDGRMSKLDSRLEQIEIKQIEIMDRLENFDSDISDKFGGNAETVNLLLKDIYNLKQDIENLNNDLEEVKISKEQEQEKEVIVASAPVPSTPKYIYDVPTDGLTPSGGVNFFGDNGEQKETYYNLPMSGVIGYAQAAGIEGEYWVREDGAKMYGDYVIIAANQDIHPYGSVVDTSLGQGIVLDTGSFAANNPYQVDIATDW